MGLNADALRDRCVALGEGVTGFALANRRAVNRIHPSLDFVDANFRGEQEYCVDGFVAIVQRRTVSLGALSVYSTT